MNKIRPLAAVIVMVAALLGMSGGTASADGIQTWGISALDGYAQGEFHSDAAESYYRVKGLIKDRRAGDDCSILSIRERVGAYWTTVKSYKVCGGMQITFDFASKINYDDHIGLYLCGDYWGGWRNCQYKALYLT